MSIALVSRGLADCPIDSSRLYGALTSIAHGPGFPAITTASDNPDVSNFLLVVTATPQAKTPGFNPAARDRQVTCLVTGKAILRHEGGAGIEDNASERVVWQAWSDAAQEDLSPAGVDGHAERIVRDLAERFGAEWRQSQER
jgi:hypothetical protein